MRDFTNKIDKTLLILCELHGVSISISDEKYSTDEYVAFESELEYLVLTKNNTIVKVLCSENPDGSLDYKTTTNKAKDLKFVIEFFGLQDMKPSLC